jgi:hypothetical protein
MIGITSPSARQDYGDEVIGESYPFVAIYNYTIGVSEKIGVVLYQKSTNK